MNRRYLTAATLATLVLLGSSSASWAQQTSCLAPGSCSLSPNVTTSQIQIGGPGSVSSNNTSPATCDGGTPGNLVSAQYQFSFDRSAGQLTIVVTNTTMSPNAGALTGFAFNVTSDVTLITLASTSGSSLTWSGAFDRDRTDNIMEVPPGTGNIKCDGFGKFNVFSGNKGVSTGFGGGDASEILPGNSVTFVFNVSGNLANVTACSFTSVASIIPPGDKTAIAIGRFQACNGGGSAWAGPCTPRDLLVSLLSFDARPGSNRGLIRWETASEIDNAGFYVLRQDARKKDYVRVNEALIQALGTQTSGAVYTFEDGSALNGMKFKYLLEDIEYDGDNTLHHPHARTIVINPDITPINLVGPAYEEAVSIRGGARLRWDSASAPRQQTLELSSDAAFSAAGTMRIHVGSTNARSLSRRELEAVGEMAALSGEGGVYWRVAGKDARGNALQSQTFFFFVND